MVRRLISVCLGAALLLSGYLLGTMAPASPVVAQDGDRQCFQETGKCVAGSFLAYWRANGGLRQQGLPISDEMQENGRTVQYFERARFEWHPQNSPENQVLLGLLGSEQYKARYQTPPPQPTIEIRGASGKNTDLFSLAGGTYKVRWEAQDPPGRVRVGCYHGASLVAEAGGFSESIANAAIEAGGGQTAETNVYRVPAGRFYLRINSGCTWAFWISEVRG